MKEKYEEFSGISLISFAALNSPIISCFVA